MDEPASYPSSYLTKKCTVHDHPEKGGRSVFAHEAISAGELIAMWSGRLVGFEELDTLPDVIRRHTVQVEEDLYLASFRADEGADFINHSCSPNAGLRGQIAVVAMRDIATGEEVTIDYAMCDGTAYDEFACACHTQHCRGRVTGRDWLDRDLWVRYAGYFSPYLQRRIDRLRRQRTRRSTRKPSIIATIGSAPGSA